MNIHLTTLLESVFSFLIVLGKQNQSVDMIDDPYDDAYENLKADIGQSTKMNDHTRPEKKTSEAINLEDTEIVRASDNIYYDI